jgi:TolA-binding protein
MSHNCRYFQYKIFCAEDNSMSIIRLAGLMAFIVLISLPLYPADQMNEGQSLDALADDLKFQNGVGFIKIKMPEKALETFHEYLEIYYNGTHRPDAYRYIAEIYFNRMEYLKAIDNYRTLYEEFSNTENGIEAYYNIGICYIKMGYENKAAEIFNEIIDRHQDSAYRQQAELQLNLLKILQE